MRLLHTADWHLGRQLHGHDLVEDQAHALRELVALAKDARPDAVVVAGDVFDRALPPVDAVALLDETLFRLVAELRLPTLLIAGNHDAPQRLAFGRRLFRDLGLVVVGTCHPHEALLLEDEHGPVALHGLAYADPASVREALGCEATDHAASLAAQIAACVREAGVRSIAVAHAFVAEGVVSDSERPLAVGGAGIVPASAFAGFCYTALGHLHAPQSFVADRVRYAGSLLKYSKSEAGHAKSTSLVEIDREGVVTVEAVALDTRRDLRILRGTLAELLAMPRTADYVVAELTDLGTLHDAPARLKERFPHLAAVERTALDFAGGAAARASSALKRELPELFAEFWEATQRQPLEAGEAALLRELVEEWEAEERGDMP